MIVSHIVAQMTTKEKQCMLSTVAPFPSEPDARDLFLPQMGITVQEFALGVALSRKVS